MAGLARRLAPAAALGGVAVVIVGVADPALAGRSADAATGGSTGTTTSAAGVAPGSSTDGSSTDGGSSGSTPDAGSASTCASGETVSGDAYSTPWGPVQVEATVADGQVCEVHAVAYPSGDGRSQMINAYAIPRLDSWATASPTAFDYVSGATYTSNGYHNSVQSILDQL